MEDPIIIQNDSLARERERSDSDAVIPAGIQRAFDRLDRRDALGFRAVTWENIDITQAQKEKADEDYKAACQLEDEAWNSKPSTKKELETEV